MALHPYFCHLCRVYFRIGTNLHDPKCLYCDTRFVEEAESVDEQSETEEDDDDDDDDDMEDQTALYLTLRSAPRLAQDGHQGTQQARWVVHFADDDDDNSDNDNDTRIEEDKDESLEDALEAMSLDEQQWETEDDYGNVSSSISTSRPGSVIAASASSSSSLSFASSSSSPHQPTSVLLSSPASSSSSSSSLYRPPSSSLSSPSSSSSLPRTSGSHQQQHRSLSSTNHSSSTRQDSFFRIERLLDIIYQGYSESENEHDDTHRSFMDNLMEIFSDPMETPQASNSDDLDQCIERLSRRTLLQDNSETKLECTICQESFGANAEILQMPCQHEYHTVCISQWLHVNATCPICRCPVIMERSDDLGPPPAFSLGSLTTRRHSYPSITDEDTQVFDDDDDDDDDYHDGDDEDEVLSDYYEMIDPPPMWARSSSSATVTRYLCTYHHLS